MNQTTKILLAFPAFVALVIIFLAQREKAPEPLNESSSNQIDIIIRTQVTEFGRTLKNVSLLMPPSDIATQLQVQYGKYLTPELLAQWQADPTQALGRSVSSPWPERIDIVSITKQEDNSYAVQGDVIEVANGNTLEPVAVYPVTLTLRSVADTWLIAQVQKENYKKDIPQRIRVQGVWECLPHRNTSGPHTLECAFGIAVDHSDAHYGLNLLLPEQGPIDYPTGTHIEVEGILMPKDESNSNTREKYLIDGIIGVTSIKEI